jgi:hypothetical protein
MKLFGTLLGFAVACGLANAANATVLIQEGFESLSPGTIMRTVPGWVGTTNLFTVADDPGLAASGTHYLSAPSRTGPGELMRFVWFDASGAFNARPAGNNLVVADVKMFVPDLTENTYGGMFMYDQFGDYIGVIGVDMSTHTTLTSANDGVNNISVNIGAYNDLEMFANFNSGLVTYLFNGTNIGFSQMTPDNLAAGFGDYDFYNNGVDATVSIPFRYDDYSVAAVPEPDIWALLIFGQAMAGCFVRRRRDHAIAQA